MARQDVITVENEWVELSAEPITALTVQNVGSHEVELLNNPIESRRPVGLVLPPRTALVNRTLAELFPGTVAAGATARIYARARLNSSSVFVSHA